MPLLCASGLNHMALPHQVRQTLGALLTEQGLYDRALKVYDEDLQLFPDNPWALAGMRNCLRSRVGAGAVGRGATSDPRLTAVEEKLRKALKTADVPIEVSCACARAGA